MQILFHIYIFTEALLKLEFEGEPNYCLNKLIILFNTLKKERKKYYNPILLLKIMIMKLYISPHKKMYMNLFIFIR